MNDRLLQIDYYYFFYLNVEIQARRSKGLGWWNCKIQVIAIMFLYYISVESSYFSKY